MTEVNIAIENLEPLKQGRVSKLVKIVGELDETNVDEKMQQIYGVIGENPWNLDLIFDFTGLGYLNSKSIGYLTDIYGKLAETNGKISIFAARPNVLDTLQVVGLTQLINMYDSFEQAKAGLIQDMATPIVETTKAPDAPVQPVIENPAAPVAPVQTAPEAPATTVEPVQTAPEAPATPVAPAQPTPEKPATPVAPVQPAPEAPTTPVAPVQPAPETPATPVAPDQTPIEETPPDVLVPAPTSSETTVAPVQTAPTTPVPPVAPTQETTVVQTASNQTPEVSPLSTTDTSNQAPQPEANSYKFEG